MTTATGETKKYADFLSSLPYGIDGYYHYGQAMEAAIAQDKPLFIDFTGHGCVNCREMEQRVWSDPEVQRLLREEFVVVSLYGDDKKNVPEEDWVTLPNGKVLKENLVGKDIVNYDSMLVLAHFKGHPMGGYERRYCRLQGTAAVIC